MMKSALLMIDLRRRPEKCGFNTQGPFAGGFGDLDEVFNSFFGGFGFGGGSRRADPNAPAERR